MQRARFFAQFSERTSVAGAFGMMLVRPPNSAFPSAASAVPGSLSWRSLRREIVRVLLASLPFIEIGPVGGNFFNIGPRRLCEDHAERWHLCHVPSNSTTISARPSASARHCLLALTFTISGALLEKLLRRVTSIAASVSRDRADEQTCCASLPRSSSPLDERGCAPPLPQRPRRKAAPRGRAGETWEERGHTRLPVTMPPTGLS